MSGSDERIPESEEVLMHDYELRGGAQGKTVSREDHDSTAACGLAIFFIVFVVIAICIALYFAIDANAL